MAKSSNDNELVPTQNILLIYSDSEKRVSEQQALADQFFGSVIRDPIQLPSEQTTYTLYICGDLSEATLPPSPCFIIRELSSGYEQHLGESKHKVQDISRGQVPHSIHNLGVYFPAFFEPDDYFGKISSEHEFQQLTESNKPNHALRSGIYLSNVTQLEQSGDLGSDEEPALRFHLMRCSSNLTGPTDNFRATDRRIIEAVNQCAQTLFEHEVDLNHVLAQIYTNRRESDQKQTKARIGAHSDKTKDMTPHGVMAFCSFYHQEELAQLSQSKSDPYDYVYKTTSGLTRLHFKLKRGVEEEGHVPHFTVTLYPNSVLFIPLSTNRLYTHEIRPPMLNAELTPTRMGYVVRCSGTEAIFDNGQTFIIEDGKRIQLAAMQSQDAQSLRTSYFTENATDEHVEYGDVYFSMNAGDYMKPIY